MLNYNQTMERINIISGDLKTLKAKTDIYTHREKLRKYKNAGRIEAIKEAEAQDKLHYIFNTVNGK